MRRARTLMTALVCLCLPRAAKPAALRALGHSVAAGVRIGPSLVLTERLALAKGASIGAFNFLALRRLLLREGAAIGSMNVIKRGQSALLKRRAAIGNRNVILRGWTPSAIRSSLLKIGYNSKITSSHYLEMTECISVGDNSVVAGVRSQIWTHGFVHDRTGPGRKLVIGPVVIGDNVYVSSGCIINCGLRIANAVSIGSGASVAKSLEEEGVYVAQPLRHLRRTPDERVAGLTRIDGATPMDTYFSRVP